MKTSSLWIASLCVLLTVGFVFGAALVKELTTPEAVVYDADSAFTFLMTLAGDWNRGSGGDDHGHSATGRTVNFRVSAGASAVIETFYAGQTNEMITVFHRNGDELLMTHYCALQNAPVMKFEKSDKPGEIKFVFQGGTNFDPKVDAHVHEGAFRIKDKDHVESDFVTFAEGKPTRAPKALMQRKPSQ